MLVNQIFYSLQGEGFLAGTPSVFIRLAGCPLRCRWCDTKYALDPASADEMSVDQVVEAVSKYSCRSVVITGGEPMASPPTAQTSELPSLLTALKDLGRHITIETAGIRFIAHLPCDLMSISPKLGNSTPKDSGLAARHEEYRFDPAALRALIEHYDYQLKFVVDCREDLPEIEQVIEQLGNVDRNKVLLMPQASTRDELLGKSVMVAELCKQTGYAFSPRLQILLWENRPGT